VYRVNGSDLTLLGTSATTSYVDAGLVNGTTYCYVVRSIGAYGDPDIAAPLLNWSQEVCAVPEDRTPPCAPTLALDNDCELPLNTLTWNNPNESCADDTYRYLVLYKDSIDGTYGLLAELIGAESTSLTHVNGSSVAGCYRITAIDTLGNESAPSNEVCGDNCPVYALPNVFTPNGDSVNDLFGPFPYRGVHRIDLQVFNRWGQVVFTSTDPDINWRGTYMDTNEFVPDGVYYYLCTVSYARLQGGEVKQLNGVVHVLDGGVLPAGN
jgi:gliding motility-associated-like protein